MSKTFVLCVPDLFNGCGEVTSSNIEWCCKCNRRLWTKPNYIDEKMKVGQTIFYKNSNGFVEKGIIALIGDKNLKLKKTDHLKDLKDDQVVIRSCLREYKSEKYDQIRSIDEISSSLLTLPLNKRTPSKSDGENELKRKRKTPDVEKKEISPKRSKTPSKVKAEKVPTLEVIKKEISPKRSKTPSELKANKVQSENANVPSFDIFSPSRPKSGQKSKSKSKVLKEEKLPEDNPKLYEKTPVDKKTPEKVNSPKKTSNCIIS